LAVHIAEKEGADMEIVKLAAPARYWQEGAG